MPARKLLFVILLFFVFGYAIFELRELLFAPTLVILKPRMWSELSDSHVMIAGYTDPGATVIVNGKRLIADSRGIFKETILFHPGYHMIKFQVTDRLGNTTQKTRKIFIK